MGSRLHKAIGYGMPIGQFKFHAQDRFDDSDDLYNYIEEKVAQLHDLVKAPRQDIIDKLESESWSRVWYLTYDVQHPKKWASPSSMFDIVWEGDDQKYLIFYPTLDMPRQWSRSNDDIDCIEEGIGDACTWETEIVPLEYGIYPWSNNIRDAKTNQPVKWDGGLHMARGDKRPEIIVPDVPSSLRYWMLATGLLDTDGINALRPVYAKWWV